RTAAFYQVDVASIVVIHDEIDLPLGTLRIKVGGGHAGHNGLRSIVQDLGSSDFIRLRCGAGRPDGKGRGVGHVLGDFGKSEKVEAEIMIKEAGDAVEDIVTRGALLAMNKTNVREREKD